MHVLIYYALTYLILLYYGIEVCPYLEKITIPKLAINQALFFVPVFFIQFYAVRNYIDKGSSDNTAKRLFRLHISSFLFIGIGLAVFNMIFYGEVLFGSIKENPHATYNSIVSGLKVVLGTAILGFFASLDLVLKKERSIINRIIESGSRATVNAGFFSLPSKFLLVTVLGGVFIVVILLLIVVKDFQWLRGNIATYGVESALKSVVFEIVFVVVILFGFGVNIIISYSKNLKLFFSLQTKVLNKVADGQLDSYVPVVNNDEFGLIASHTNTMIDDLKEKNRIKNMFGKVMSPIIADRIVNQDKHGEGVKMGGGKQELIVLFSDIRSFTTLSENTNPEGVVDFLNKYFAKMVPIIQDHGGIIDKFIGDGIFAVFGLDEHGGYESRAVLSAIKMQAAVDELNKETGMNTQIGIGLHKGGVIAGIIGSPDRLEFTFIGDVVNTTARLEALTKELKARVLISVDLYNVIFNDKDGDILRKLPWIDYGKQALKGKQTLVSVMGIARST